MHLLTYRYYINGLQVMKYTNNHPQNFYNPYVCFLLGTVTVLISAGIEFVNLIILYQKESIFLVLNAFIT